MAAVLVAASYSRIGYSLCLAVRAWRVRVPVRSVFHLEPGTIPLSMVFYRITLVPLAEELRETDPRILYPLYPDDAAFDGSAQHIAQLLKLLMKRGPGRGYLPQLDKYLFFLDTPGQEEAARRGFVVEGIDLNFVSGIIYLGAYLIPQ